MAAAPTSWLCILNEHGIPYYTHKSGLPPPEFGFPTTGLFSVLASSAKKSGFEIKRLSSRDAKACYRFYSTGIIIVFVTSHIEYSPEDVEKQLDLIYASLVMSVGLKRLQSKKNVNKTLQLIKPEVLLMFQTEDMQLPSMGALLPDTVLPARGVAAQLDAMMSAATSRLCAIYAHGRLYASSAGWSALQSKDLFTLGLFIRRLQLNALDTPTDNAASGNDSDKEEELKRRTLASGLMGRGPRLLRKSTIAFDSDDEDGGGGGRRGSMADGGMLTDLAEGDEEAGSPQARERQDTEDAENSAPQEEKEDGAAGAETPQVFNVSAVFLTASAVSEAGEVAAVGEEEVEGAQELLNKHKPGHVEYQLAVVQLTQTVQFVFLSSQSSAQCTQVTRAFSEQARGLLGMDKAEGGSPRLNVPQENVLSLSRKDLTAALQRINADFPRVLPPSIQLNAGVLGFLFFFRKRRLFSCLSPHSRFTLSPEQQLLHGGLSDPAYMSKARALLAFYRIVSPQLNSAFVEEIEEHVSAEEKDSNFNPNSSPAGSSHRGGAHSTPKSRMRRPSISETSAGLVIPQDDGGSPLKTQGSTKDITTPSKSERGNSLAGVSSSTAPPLSSRSAPSQEFPPGTPVVSDAYMRVQEGGLYALQGEQSSIFVLYGGAVPLAAYQRMAWQLLSQLNHHANSWVHF